MVAGADPVRLQHGLRRESLLACRRSWFAEEATGRWLFVPRENVKGRRPKRLYCSRAAWSAVERFCAAAGDGPIFPWPHAPHGLYGVQRELLANSTLAPARRLGLHALRKALATELAAINPLVASMQLGHSLGRNAGANVTRDHYTHRRVWAEAMERVPQPPIAPAGRADADPQQLLF